MFAAVVLEVAAPPGVHPSASAYHGYAAVLDLLGRADPALAQTLHDSDPKRLTVSPARRVLGEPDHWWLRVCFLGGEAVGAAIAALARLAPDQPLQLGPVETILRAIHLAPGRHNAVAVATWDDLLQPAPERSLTLRFVTPTGFRLAGGHQGLLPEPRRLFGGLQQRWQALGGPPLPAPEADFERQVRVEAVRLLSRTVRFGDFEQLGVTGSVTYGVPAGDRTLHTVTALGRLASFTGVGAKTAMGMGQVQLLARPLRHG